MIEITTEGTISVSPLRLYAEVVPRTARNARSRGSPIRGTNQETLT